MTWIAWGEAKCGVGVAPLIRLLRHPDYAGGSIRATLAWEIGCAELVEGKEAHRSRLMR